MSAQILDGKSLSFEIKKDLEKEVKKLNDKGVFPRLDVILVGENMASKIYVKYKEKDCEEVGIISKIHSFDENIDELELIRLITKLNEDEKVHGILVQLPLPNQIDKNKIINLINPKKDVDGFTDINIGKMFRKDEGLYPCTPCGVIQLLKKYNINISGKHAVVIGKSNIVGKPMSVMLLNENATVTVCHSKTKNLSDITKQADILICAVGKVNLITADMVKDDVIVVDIGINRGSNGKLVGDVDFLEIFKKASFITPVPGGVGPMTRAVLLQNTLLACLIKR